MKPIDMTGWVMSEHGVPDSRLTVLKEAEPHITSGGNKQRQWLCLCDCGKKIIVKGNSLRNGNTKSCGCLHSELLSKRNAENSSVKVGNVYGKLTVIKDLGMRKQQSRDKNERWSLCQCSCGSGPIEVRNNELQNGWKKSCGCLSSYGEFIIKKILEENNVNFIQQYSFSDLLGENNGLLRFDFAIFKNLQLQYLIEFDGRQHSEEPEGKWTEGQSLKTIQHHDKLKNDYCLKHNIILKRIPFFDLKTFTYQDIISDKYNINKLL